jgi:hypothetical protein
MLPHSNAGLSGDGAAVPRGPGQESLRVAAAGIA